MPAANNGKPLALYVTGTIPDHLELLNGTVLACAKAHAAAVHFPVAPALLLHVNQNKVRSEELDALAPVYESLIMSGAFAELKFVGRSNLEARLRRLFESQQHERARRTRIIRRRLDSILGQLTDSEFDTLFAPDHEDWLALLIQEAVYRVAGRKKAATPAIPS